MIGRFCLKMIEYKKILYIFVFLYLLAFPAILNYNKLGRVLLSILLIILSYATYDFLKKYRG